MAATHIPNQRIEIENRIYTIKIEQKESPIDEHTATIKRGTETYTCTLESKSIKYFETAIKKEHGMTYIATKFEDKIIIKLNHPLFPIEGQYNFIKSINPDHLTDLKQIKTKMDLESGIPIYPDMLGPLYKVAIKEPTIDVKTATEFFDKYTDVRNFTMATPQFTPSAGDHQQCTIYRQLCTTIQSEYSKSYVYQKTKPIVSPKQFCVKYYQQHCGCHYFGYHLIKYKDCWTIYTPKSELSKDTIGYITYKNQHLCARLYHPATIAIDDIKSARKLDTGEIALEEAFYDSQGYMLTLPFDVEDGYYSQSDLKASPNQPPTMLIKANKIYMLAIEKDRDLSIPSDQFSTISLQNVKLAE